MILRSLPSGVGTVDYSNPTISYPSFFLLNSTADTSIVDAAEDECVFWIPSPLK